MPQPVESTIKVTSEDPKKKKGEEDKNKEENSDPSSSKPAADGKGTGKDKEGDEAEELVRFTLMMLQIDVDDVFLV